jgi:cell fate (sporulation/competence/biofilm development) regulator YlbF (YheA/YmcA/DUF963 family)
MSIATVDNVVLEKTKELCQTILDHPTTASIVQRMEAFMADENARAQYATVMAKGQELQDKQNRSLTLEPAEIADFERERETLLNNPAARDFFDAQEEMQSLRQSITQYVTRTLELGRVPTEEDFEAKGCGHGCSCGH